MASGIGVPEVASRNDCTSASRLPGLLVADVAATRRLERIHVRQLLFRHCFYEGSSNLGLQSVRNRSCRTYASPFKTASPCAATLGKIIPLTAHAGKCRGWVRNCSESRKLSLRGACAVAIPMLQQRRLPPGTPLRQRDCRAALAMTLSRNSERLHRSWSFIRRVPALQGLTPMASPKARPPTAPASSFHSSNSARHRSNCSCVASPY